MSLSPTRRPSLDGNNRRILFALLAVILVMGAGAIGFHLIEGWSILDSLYASAQTVTTVGYGDIVPATRKGRLFAIGFMVTGVGVVLYALTATVHAIIQSRVTGHLR